MKANEIAWHEQNIKNVSNYCQRKKQELIKLEKEIAEIEARLIFYTQQVNEAKRLGKTEFDAERFLRNKK